MWKSEKGAEECGAEMQPFTSLPVYQPTQRPLRHRRWGIALRETRCVAWRTHRVMSLYPCEKQKKEQRSVGLRCSPLLRCLFISQPRDPCGIDDEGSLSGRQGVSPGGCIGLWVCTHVKIRKRSRGVCGWDAALYFAACLSANPETPAASTMRAPSQGDKVCRLEEA